MSKQDHCIKHMIRWIILLFFVFVCACNEITFITPAEQLNFLSSFDIHHNILSSFDARPSSAFLNVAFFDASATNIIIPVSTFNATTNVTVVVNIPVVVGGLVINDFTWEAREEPWFLLPQDEIANFTEALEFSIVLNQNSCTIDIDFPTSGINFNTIGECLNECGRSNNFYIIECSVSTTMRDVTIYDNLNQYEPQNLTLPFATLTNWKIEQLNFTVLDGECLLLDHVMLGSPISITSEGRMGLDMGGHTIVPSSSDDRIFSMENTVSQQQDTFLRVFNGTFDLLIPSGINEQFLIARESVAQSNSAELYDVTINIPTSALIAVQFYPFRDNGIVWDRVVARNVLFTSSLTPAYLPTFTMFGNEVEMSYVTIPVFNVDTVLGLTQRTIKLTPHSNGTVIGNIVHMADSFDVFLIEPVAPELMETFVMIDNEVKEASPGSIGRSCYHVKTIMPSGATMTGNKCLDTATCTAAGADIGIKYQSNDDCARLTEFHASNPESIGRILYIECLNFVAGTLEGCTVICSENPPNVCTIDPTFNIGSPFFGFTEFHRFEDIIDSCNVLFIANGTHIVATSKTLNQNIAIFPRDPPLVPTMFSVSSHNINGGNFSMEFINWVNSDPLDLGTLFPMSTTALSGITIKNSSFTGYNNVFSGFNRGLASFTGNSFVNISGKVIQVTDPDSSMISDGLDVVVLDNTMENIGTFFFRANAVSNLVNIDGNRCEVGACGGTGSDGFIAITMKDYTSTDPCLFRIRENTVCHTPQVTDTLDYTTLFIRGPFHNPSCVIDVKSNAFKNHAVAIRSVDMDQPDDFLDNEPGGHIPIAIDDLREIREWSVLNPLSVGNNFEVCRKSTSDIFLSDAEHCCKSLCPPLPGPLICRVTGAAFEPNDFVTVQDAVNGCTLLDPILGVPIIYVLNGPYNEIVSITSGLVLRSFDANKPYIDSIIITGSPNPLLIQGLTIDTLTISSNGNISLIDNCFDTITSLGAPNPGTLKMQGNTLVNTDMTFNIPNLIMENNFFDGCVITDDCIRITSALTDVIITGNTFIHSTLDPMFAAVRFIVTDSVTNQTNIMISGNTIPGSQNGFIFEGPPPPDVDGVLRLLSAKNTVVNAVLFDFKWVYLGQCISFCNNGCPTDPPGIFIQLFVYVIPGALIIVLLNFYCCCLGGWENLQRENDQRKLYKSIQDDIEKATIDFGSKIKFS